MKYGIFWFTGGHVTENCDKTCFEVNRGVIDLKLSMIMLAFTPFFLVTGKRTWIKGWKFYINQISRLLLVPLLFLIFTARSQRNESIFPSCSSWIDCPWQMSKGETSIRLVDEVPTQVTRSSSPWRGEWWCSTRGICKINKWDRARKRWGIILGRLMLMGMGRSVQPSFRCCHFCDLCFFCVSVCDLGPFFFLGNDGQLYRINFIKLFKASQKNNLFHIM